MRALSVRRLCLGEEFSPGEEFNFDVEQGEIVCILGENGSGKSLLHSCLCGQRRSPEASVSVCGQELFARRSRPAALAALGVVFQHPGLLRTLSVYDNVALPFLESSIASGDRLAELVGLRLRLLGCGHLLGDETGSLGNGEKRCVALARALSGSTRVLLADDPTAGLSPGLQARVGELLTALIGRGALDAAVLCTQDIDFALRVGTRFLFVHSPVEGRLTGGIREERRAADVLNEPRPREISAFLSRHRDWHR
jgi:ABC-type branched-subunit amino acid transport system ATPase component